MKYGFLFMVFLGAIFVIQSGFSIPCEEETEGIQKCDNNNVRTCICFNINDNPSCSWIITDACGQDQICQEVGQNAFCWDLIKITLDEKPNSISIPQESYFSGTLNVAGNVKYRVDDTNWISVCSNCLTFSFTTPSQPYGDHTVTIYAENSYSNDQVSWSYKIADGSEFNFYVPINHSYQESAIPIAATSNVWPKSTDVNFKFYLSPINNPSIKIDISSGNCDMGGTPGWHDPVTDLNYCENVVPKNTATGAYKLIAEWTLRGQHSKILRDSFQIKSGYIYTEDISSHGGISLASPSYTIGLEPAVATSNKFYTCLGSSLYVNDINLVQVQCNNGWTTLGRGAILAWTYDRNGVQTVSHNKPFNSECIFHNSSVVSREILFKDPIFSKKGYLPEQCDIRWDFQGGEPSFLVKKFESPGIYQVYLDKIQAVSDTPDYICPVDVSSTICRIGTFVSLPDELLRGVVNLEKFNVTVVNPRLDTMETSVDGAEYNGGVFNITPIFVNNIIQNNFKARWRLKSTGFGSAKITNLNMSCSENMNCSLLTNAPIIVEDTSQIESPVVNPFPNVFNTQTLSNSLDSNLLLYWQFNENSGRNLIDSSPYSHNGELNTWMSRPQGLAGTSLEFTGSQYGSADIPLPTSNITISLWIKPTSVSEFRHPIGLDKGHRGTIYLWSNGQRICFKFDDSNLGGERTEGCFGNYVLNQWHHVVVTFDGHEVKGYLNGVLGNIVVRDQPLRFENNRIFIGTSYPSIWGNYYSGGIDEVRIYNRALSEQEIQELYKYPDELLHYSFNQLTLNMIKDNSAYGNNGQNSGVSSTKGVLGKGAHFSGSNYIRTSKAILNPSATDFSISLWVKPEQSSSSINEDLIAQEDENGKGRTWLYISREDGTNRWKSYLGGVATDTGTVAEPNKWTYLTLTYKQKSHLLAIYVDGVKKVENTVLTESDAGSLIIGSHKSRNKKFFVGDMDEVVVYRRALTPGEIQKIYEKGLAGKVVDYRLDEGSGNIASDSSGNRYYGVLSGASWSQGKSGYGLLFNGNSYVRSEEIVPKDFEDEVTVATWIKSSNLAPQQSLVDMGRDYYGSGWRLFLYNNEIMFSVNTDNANNGNEMVISAPYPSDGDWHQVVATYGPDMGASLYIDGVKKATGSYKGPIVFRYNEHLALGCLSFQLCKWFKFNGYLDNIRVWNKEMTDNEINAIFDPKNSFLVLNNLWRFDEPGGNIIQDDGYRNITGTLNNVDRVMGRIGLGALKFKGSNSRVELSNNLDLSQSFTFGVWVKRTDDINSTQKIFNNKQFKVVIKPKNENPDRAFEASLSMQDGSLLEVSSGIKSVIDRWYYLTVVYNTTHLAIYVDGELKDIAQNKKLVTNNQIKPLIGEKFIGLLDDVRFYKGALNSSQIKELYTEFLSLPVIGPEIWINFTMPLSPETQEINLSAYYTDAYDLGCSGASVINETIRVKWLDILPPDIICDDCDEANGGVITFKPVVTDPQPGTGVASIKICKDPLCKEVFCEISSGDQCSINLIDFFLCDFKEQEYYVVAQDLIGNTAVKEGGTFTVKKNMDCPCSFDEECISGLCAGTPSLCIENPVPIIDLI